MYTVKNKLQSLLPPSYNGVGPIKSFILYNEEL